MRHLGLACRLEGSKIKRFSGLRVRKVGRPGPGFRVQGFRVEKVRHPGLAFRVSEVQGFKIKTV